MNVTLRTSFPPDVFVQDSGTTCDIAKLDQQIRTLQAARSWLVKESASKQAKPETKKK